MACIGIECHGETLLRGQLVPGGPEDTIKSPVTQSAVLAKQSRLSSGASAVFCWPGPRPEMLQRYRRM